MYERNMRIGRGATGSLPPDFGYEFSKPCNTQDRSCDDGWSGHQGRRKGFAAMLTPSYTSVPIIVEMNNGIRVKIGRILPNKEYLYMVELEKRVTLIDAEPNADGTPCVESENKRRFAPEIFHWFDVMTNEGYEIRLKLRFADEFC